MQRMATNGRTEGLKCWYTIEMMYICIYVCIYVCLLEYVNVNMCEPSNKKTMSLPTND